MAREQALHEVEETLLNIEQAIRELTAAARRSLLTGATSRTSGCALDHAVEQLEAVRKGLFQSGYFGGQQQRLI